MPAQPMDYKARKEAFVSNLSGSSITDVLVLSLVPAAALLLWTSLQARQSLFTPYGPLSAIVDFLLNICAFLFAITVYSSAPLLLSLALATPAAFLLLLDRQKSSSVDDSTKKTSSGTKKASSNLKVVENATNHLVARPFLTHYRGAMLISTFLAILAVDFPVFPRRFAKVETWGTSLMDLGVGSFVFSAGVVSARALFKESQQGHRPNLLSRLLAATKHSIPLFILGIIRLISVKGLDYAEHVTEYGVHWNFFFTLGLLPPFVELSDSLLQILFTRYIYVYPWLALTLAFIYQLILSHTRLLSYILISPRDPHSLLSLNREGIFSFTGYLSIFLAGRGTGAGIVTELPPRSLKAPSTWPRWRLTNRERTLILWSIVSDLTIYTLLFLLATSVYTFNLNVSRRLANLPYVLLVCAFNNAQLILFGLVEAVGPKFSYAKEDVTKLREASSKIMQVFNKNGLVIFLVANLLTGLVNLTVKTLDVSNLVAMMVLILYAAAVTVVALGLDASGIKIKL